MMDEMLISLSETEKYDGYKWHPWFRLEILDYHHDYADEIGEWFRITIDGQRPLLMVDPNTFAIIIDFEHKVDAIAFCLRFGQQQQLRIKKFYEFSLQEHSTTK